ncbi:MAG TPA: ATP-binding protein, partial [Syntrophorhabdaceae bacterium]|nr:ATP-binding protein [Syntrophorhabdaceae bacterium]
AASPEKLGDGTVLWSGYAREVNERKLLEEQLREAHEDLIRLSEKRTQRLLEANDRLSTLNDEIKNEIKERIKLEKNLKDSYELLSSLAGNLVRSEDRERRRIAVELHDNVVQHLALGKLRLDVGLNKGTPSTELLQEQSRLMVEAMQQIREICNDLSPPVLYDFGLAKALKNMGDNLAQKTMPHLNLEYDLEDLHLPDYAKAFLYQTARELIINAIKHAQASRLRVTLRKNHRTIRLTIEDDGIGFTRGMRQGFGLINIQQRTLFHKGRLSIDSSADMNTVVTVEIPTPAVKKRAAC